MHQIRDTRRIATRAAIVLVMLAASTACVRLGSKPPARLLTIASEVSAPTGVIASGPNEPAIFLEEPGSPKSLATLRVAVRDSATSFAYVKDALWVELPSRQFRSLLADTIRARGSRLVLDPSQYSAREGMMLRGNLVSFGIDALQNRAVVTFDAAIASPDGLTVMSQRFSASRPVRHIAADSVAPAISAAANEVAVAVADWVSQQK